MSVIKYNSMCVGKEYNYKEKHKNLMDRVSAIELEYIDLMEVLDSFNKGDDKPINKDDLEKFPLLEWVNLNEYISIRKRKKLFKDYLNFDTKLKKGGEFGEHFHDDIIENAEVISGKMLDSLDGSIYEVNDIMHYEKGQKHTPVALEDTLLKVIFKP